MATYRACLVDVYETILRCDFAAHATDMQELIGVGPDDWAAALRDTEARVSDGTMSLFDAFAGVAQRNGSSRDEDHIHQLVAYDQELLRRYCTVFEDTVPFLEQLRERGIPTALVSNCAENTRPLLDYLGLSALVDELVLSCEIGSSKPDHRIYQAALDRLDVTAPDAVLIDDQESYCQGATAMGITAIRIDRNGTGAAGVPRSLLDLTGHFS